MTLRFIIEHADTVIPLTLGFIFLTLVFVLATLHEVAKCRTRQTFLEVQNRMILSAIDRLTMRQNGAKRESRW